MSTTSPVLLESKSAKKRRAKAEAAVVTSSADQQTPPDETAANGIATHDNVNGAENLYLKELTKNIRNLHKKLAGTAKADSVVEQNPGISIDDLVVQKKLNADQKAQLLKKPSLQAQLTQLEEQHKHYQSFAQELEDKHGNEKAALIESHEAALAQAQQALTDAETAKSSQSGQHEHALKVITGFLHAAAAMRQTEDHEADEARAFEGALLLVYQGNASSLETLRNLVEGSEDKVPDTDGNLIDVTYAQIKEVALRGVASLTEGTEIDTVESAPSAAEPAVLDAETDPTIANAGLTELEDTHTLAIQTNGDATPEPSVAPEQTSTAADAANAVAEASWDPQASVTSAQTATGEDWVQVPRDPAETETGNAHPTVRQSMTSWADEAGAAAAAEEKPAVENDGFEQVRRDRGGRGRGPRGRGGDGRGRGRGRGDGHRGRGGQGRGARGGQRGDRPAPAS